MRKVSYSRSALRSLRRIPSDEAVRICAKVEQYAANPASLANNVKALAGSGFLRLRVGDWRIIISDRGDVLDVLDVGPRGSVYD